MMPSSPAYERLKQQLKGRLAELLEADVLGASEHVQQPDHDTLRIRLRQLLQEGGTRGIRAEGLTDREEEQLIDEVASELSGLDLIGSLMTDPTVSEIMVIGPEKVFVERDGRLERTPLRFRDTDHLRHWIERMLDRVGLSVNELEPFVDATLPEGARVNVIVPPLTLDGPTVTIRKQLKTFNMNELIQLNTLTPVVSEFLQACVRAKINVVISGGTSTGKTTLMSVLSTFIPAHERIITIETNGELQLPGKDHWVRLVARAPNPEGRGEISVRELVKNALRMRPDRIILGEARGGEALDMIQAMHVGHEGFFTIVHANSPRAALERLEILMLMSGLDLPVQACRVQIASALELIIHVERSVEGARRVALISQVAGVNETGFIVEDLFRTQRPETSNGQVSQGGLVPTGIRSTFTKKFEAANITVDERWFTQ